MPRDPADDTTFSPQWPVELFDAGMLGWTAIRDAQMHWWKMCMKACMMPMFPWHPHEPKEQLEIPDPIAESDEEDLFA